MKTVCAALIVKNEEKIISRCLKSIKPYIDHWIICDTGSTDDTKAIILDELSEIPGKLHDIPWKNFGHNRSILMELAKDKADYLLLLDADMILNAAGENFKKALTADSYYVRNTGPLDYAEKRLVSGKLNWKYVGVTHEYIHTEEEESVAPFYDITFSHFHDGSRRPEKFSDDINLLEEGLKEEPDNSRYKFYLAQSYYDTKEYAKAIKWYEKRIEDDGWEEEVYYSLLKRAFCLSLLSEEFPVDAFVQAYNYRPQRFEAIYEVIKYYRQIGLYRFAYLLAKETVKNPYPKKDILFINKTISDYALKDELAICAYWVGEHQESHDLSEEILKRNNIPEDDRQRILKNLEFAKDKMGARVIRK